MAVRGSPIVTLTNESTLLHGAGARPFAKARGVLRAGREALPGPALCSSCFARQQRPGWDCWGNEVAADDWLEQDAIGSYYDAIAEIGKRVRAGEPVPECLLSRRNGAKS